MLSRWSLAPLFVLAVVAFAPGAASAEPAGQASGVCSDKQDEFLGRQLDNAPGGSEDNVRVARIAFQQRITYEYRYCDKSEPGARHTKKVWTKQWSDSAASSAGVRLDRRVYKVCVYVSASVDGLRHDLTGATDGKDPSLSLKTVAQRGSKVQRRCKRNADTVSITTNRLVKGFTGDDINSFDMFVWVRYKVTKAAALHDGPVISDSAEQICGPAC